MTTNVRTIRVETHTCDACGYQVAQTNVPDLCPHCGDAAGWTTDTVAVAVAFGRTRAGDLASGRSGQAYM